jgi:hypothetical protein
MTTGPLPTPARHQEGLRDDVCAVVGLVGPADGEAEDRVDVARRQRTRSSALP